MKLLCSIDENKDTVNKEYVDNHIPTVNNGTLTIQKNGTNVQTFTANQSSNVTANITVPTKTSDLTNDSNFLVNSGTYLNIHPENGPVIIPFINNDISFLKTRGGSYIVEYDGVTQSQNIDNVFDGSPSYWAINPTGVTEIIITLTLHQTFGWSNTIYVDFGSSGWRSKNVKIEVMNSNYAQDVWTTKLNITNNSSGNLKVNVSHTPVGADNAGGGFNKIRFTFSSWNSATIFRIAQLGLYNYGSQGVRQTYMSRGIDDSVFRNITPNTNNTYNLGASDKKWKNIYAVTFTGDLSGMATKLSITDTRSVNDSPSTYFSKGKHVIYEFKSNSSINTPFSSGTYCILETICPWSDSSGGYPVQLATSSSSARPAIRVATDNNTWGSWNTLALLSDIPSSIGTVTSITIQATGPIAIDSSAAITTSGTRTISHSNSGVTAGTYRSVTVNATGHVTAGTNPTTLSGYGITDAKIESGVITLGGNTITPLTSFTETDPIFEASIAATLASEDLAYWNAKQDELESGTNIKTINGVSILGPGNLIIGEGGAVLTDVEINNVSITNEGVANLSVDGAYNATSNKIATMASVTNAVQTGLNSIDYVTYNVESFTNPILNTTSNVGVVTIGKNGNPIQLKLSNNIVKVRLNNSDIVYIGTDSTGKTRIYANNMNSLQSIKLGDFSWTKLSDGSIMFGGDD